MTNTRLHERGGGGAPFFSIVIPVYNTEKYIARCLESCIHQTFKDIEMIVVDDCGEDNAIQIAQEYAKKDSRIKIIHNPQNLGTFQTRIIGENKAFGEYILHIDSDDYIENTMCEILYSYCNQNDIVAFGLYYKQEKRLPILGTQNPAEILANSCTNGLVNKAIKRSLLKETEIILTNLLGQIPKLSMSEDGLRLFAVFLLAKNYLGIDKILYHYSHNPNSITSKFDNSSKIWQDILDTKICLNTINKLSKLDNPYQQEIKKQEKIIQKRGKRVLSDFIFLYHRSKAYESKPFAYPINFLKSLWYVRSPKIFGKTIVRIFIYLATLGKVRI